MDAEGVNPGPQDFTHWAISTKYSNKIKEAGWEHKENERDLGGSRVPHSESAEASG